mmetsp:Transcript_18566/g.22813  ORF Transcript_18566/g.22813 Transcript_18566/m.22813 type:complete len:301 (-) Transcript_18566:269-1171(-)
MEEEKLMQTLKLTGFPAVIMLVGGLTVFCIQIPENVVSGMQHFAAGIVICAVAMELMPPVIEADATVSNMVAISIGFFVGVMLMFAMETFCESDEEGDEDPSSQALVDQLQAEYGTQVLPRNEETVQSAFPVWQRRVRGKREIARLTSEADIISPYPVALMFAVCVDAMVDGLLIGISISHGQEAGFILSIALSVEMCFLGITFATGLRSQKIWIRILSLFLSSVLLVVGGCVGSLFGSMIDSSKIMQVGLMSFGTAALLYLVTEELLIEAHKGGEHSSLVDLCFFLGFWACLVLDKLSD